MFSGDSYIYIHVKIISNICVLLQHACRLLVLFLSHVTGLLLSLWKYGEVLPIYGRIQETGFEISIFTTDFIFTIAFL